MPTFNIEGARNLLEAGYTGHFQIQAIDLEDAKKKLGKAFERLLRPGKDEGYPFK